MIQFYLVLKKHKRVGSNKSNFNKIYKVIYRWLFLIYSSQYF